MCIRDRINTDLYESEYLATRAYLGLAQLGYDTKNFEESALNGESALKLAKENEFFKEIIEANTLLTNVYTIIGRFELALRNNKNLLRIRDSIFNIAKLQTEAKTAEKIQFVFMGDEIKRQEQKIEELNASKNQSDIAAILTAAMLTIITLLAISLFRNNQIKLKTNDLLQTKNNELKAARDSAVSCLLYTSDAADD